jgi:hypothetical protein
MKPLTIIVNNPRVRRIAGSERIITIGFTIVLIMEKINPAIRNIHTFVIRTLSL